MDRPDLDVLGAELQRELRLQDWRVTYVYVPDLTDATGSPVYGLCDRLVDNKTATIAIRDPLASGPLPLGAEDKPVEAVLMHELVHLSASGLAVNTPQGIIAEEQFVWPIADLLTKWRGTARGGMLARAMAMRSQKIAPKKETRNMDRASLAMLNAALGGKDPEAAIAGAKAWAKAMEETMGDNERAPESKKEEPSAGAPAARAEDMPPKKDEPPAARPAVAAAMTIGDVDARAAKIVGVALREHTERAALITANVARLTAAQAALFGTLPLADVKAHVAALPLAPATPAKPGDQRGARVTVAPIGTEGAEISALDATIDRLMGLTTPAPSALTFSARGMSISHVAALPLDQELRKLAAERQAQAAGGRS